MLKPRWIGMGMLLVLRMVVVKVGFVLLTHHGINTHRIGK